MEEVLWRRFVEKFCEGGLWRSFVEEVCELVSWRRFCGGGFMGKVCGGCLW